MKQITDVCRFHRTSSFSTAGVVKCPVVAWFCRRVWPRALILCMGCQGRPNAGATSTAADRPESIRERPDSGQTAARSGSHESGRDAGPPIGAGRAGTADFTRVVYHNGRRSRFATPGGSKRGGASRDLTSQVSGPPNPPGWSSSSRGVISGRSGRASSRSRPPSDGQSATSRITLEPAPARSWDFAEDIVPIFTRLGCNTGACHGKADGQNGFHLSLFGYDRAGDFQALARDGGQRRLSRLVPEESLFFAKATGTVPHGGGRRLTVGSPEYRTLLAWVRDGAPERRGQAARAGCAGVGRARRRPVRRAGPATAPRAGSLSRRPRARRDPAGSLSRQ